MRSKTSTIRKRRHKKILKLAKGYRMTRSKVYKVAKQAVLHAGQYAYHGRKLRKRDFRTLWIQRINASLSETGITYSKLINKLKANKIELNRKIMADLSLNHSKVFFKIVDKVK